MCFRSPFSVYKCGKCPECLQEIRRDWSIRLQLHAMSTDTRPFIAHLTYDNEHVPTTKDGKLILSKRDVQLFLKRLRSYFKDENITYYLCGEYGSNGTRRPHYHCIFFGIPSFLSQDEVTSILQKAWSNGLVRYRSNWVQSYAQLHYVTKYVINYYDDNFEGIVKPFRLCSNGLGHAFVKYATEHDLYDYEFQKTFKFEYSLIRVKCDTSSKGYREVKHPIRELGNWVYYYDEYSHEYKFNPDLVNFRDFIEFNQVYDGRLKPIRVNMPRYYAQKLYTEDFRTALTIMKQYKALSDFKEYEYLYNEYDLCSNIPMWLQQKRQRWNNKKKNYKDKNNFKDLLND